jgi:hypothetical protein
LACAPTGVVGCPNPLAKQESSTTSSGVSEAGDQLMLVEFKQDYGYDYVPRTDGSAGYTFANSHSTVGQCQASWWSLPQQGSPSEQHQVQTPDMCFSAYGGATIAPSVVRH